MDDFKDPIKIEADEGSIVGAAVTYMSRPGIAAKICSDLPNESNFTPVLMNPGDSVDIQVITDSCPEPPKLTTWIREESRPMQRRQTIIDPSLRTVLERQLKGRVAGIQERLGFHPSRARRWH